MPTGYTEGINRGKVTSVKDYALVCARAFGALMDMRDAPLGAELPKEVVPATKYYDETITSLEEEIAFLKSLTTGECNVCAELEYEEQFAKYQSYMQEAAVLADRYQSLEKNIKAWEVPESHQELKRFMLQQLEVSKSDYCTDYRSMPERLEGRKWVEKSLNQQWIV